MVPAPNQTAKNQGGCRHWGIIFALAEGSGGTELEGEFTLLFRCLLIKLGVIAEVGPRLGALGSAKNASDMQIGGAKVPRLIRVEVEPELIKTAEKEIVQQGNAPPAGGVGRDWLVILPS